MIEDEKEKSIQQAAEMRERIQQRLNEQRTSLNDLGDAPLSHVVALNYKELLIIALVAPFNNKEIAERLQGAFPGITESAVRNIVYRIQQKTGVWGRLELGFYACARGIVTVAPNAISLNDAPANEILNEVLSHVSALTPGIEIRRPTTGECNVLELLAKGCEDKEIATRLGIGIATIRTRLTSVFNKMGLSGLQRNRVVAVETAIKLGLIEAPQDSAPDCPPPLGPAHES